ncbi:MAG: PBP1A family penicillin-binding protein [Pseudomonadota bacterium]
MLRFFFSTLGGLFSLLTLGIAMVALSVGAVFYVYGRDLPDHEALRQYRPATLSRIYSTEGQIIDEFARERRMYAPAEDIPDLVKQAFISAEDKNFYEHAGFDSRGMAAALVDAIESRGQNLRGASTIPQQVAKNMLVGADLSFERKIKEIILANRMVGSLDREKILEIYLNEIFLGQNSFGVAAAAQTYFNKTLGELLPEEAAYLASLPKSPSNRHPVRQKETAVFWRDNTLREMNENGYLTDEEYETAKAAPLLSVQGGDYEAFQVQLPSRDYFTDEIRRQLSRDFGEGEFFGGGFSVRATVDADMQAAAAEALRRALERYDRAQGEYRGTGLTVEADLTDEAAWRAALASVDIPRDIEGWHPAVVLTTTETAATIGIEGQPVDDDGDWIQADDLSWISGVRRASDILSPGDVLYVRRNGGPEDDPRWSLRQIPEVQGGFMAMDVNSGRVIAIQGGFSYQHSEFNRATLATRQPGSAFKPFVFAAALDSGFTPASIVIDAPIEVDAGGGEVWRPRNASNRFYGPTPLRTGIEFSRNLMTVRLAQELGMHQVAGYAERFGVYDKMGQFLANSLGSEETTLFKMVAAYAMFANGGERVEPTLVDRVQDRWGQTIYRHDDRVCVDCANPDLDPSVAPEITSDRQRVMNAVTAYQLTSMMRGVVDRGTASGAVNLPVPTAGKTGTTNDARDVWFVGFTSNIAAGCYIGYDQPKPLGRGASGGALCAPVFQDFMEVATERYGGGPFEVPPGGQFIKINRFTGARVPDNAVGPDIVAEYFRVGEEPIFGIAFDGGFAMGADLPLFTAESLDLPAGTLVESADGTVITVPRKATFGELSSGGLY